MKSSSRSALFAGFFLALLILAVNIVVSQAAPMPPRPVVNHAERQCALVVPGDECGDILLPQGWEYLDPSYGEDCPQDYTKVELYAEWVHFKTDFCCTEGHSGSHGDCEDLIVNQAEGQCAFVEDIRQCAGLPEGWASGAETCPSKFTWIENVTCLSSPTIMATVLPASPQVEAGPSEGPEISPSAASPTQPASGNGPSSFLPCGALLVALLGLIIMRIA